MVYLADYIFVEIVIIIILVSPTSFFTKWYKMIVRSQFFKFCEHPIIFHGYTGVFWYSLYGSLRDVAQYYTHSSRSLEGAAQLARQSNLNLADTELHTTIFAILFTFVIRRLIQIINYQLEKMEEFYEFQRKVSELMQLADKIHGIQFRLKWLGNLKDMQSERVEGLDNEAIKWKLKYEEAVNARASLEDDYYHLLDCHLPFHL